MNRNQIISIALFTGVALAAGYWWGHTTGTRGHESPSVTSTGGTTDAAEGSGSAGQARRILYYRNPMGLPDSSPTPKKDPMGMDYIPVYAGEAGEVGGGVADPLRGGAQISMVNPGGLRAELFYKATVNNTADADGRILYSEANAVLPFVNNLWTLDLTGAQVKAVLEEQFQPDGVARPFLHLGLSDNMSVTLDPTQPRGSRVTSVWVNGAPLDPAATYRVGTFSFLAQGGDNFTTFTSGTNVRDSGLIDRDAWIAYLTAHAPATPSFARRQVFQTGMPTSVVAGQSVSFTIAP